MLTEAQKRASITPHDVAEAMGVSLPVAYAIVNRADFPKIRFGRRIIISRAAFEKWFEETATRGDVDLKTDSPRAAYGR